MTVSGVSTDSSVSSTVDLSNSAGFQRVTDYQNNMVLSSALMFLSTSNMLLSMSQVR